MVDGCLVGGAGDVVGDVVGRVVGESEALADRIMTRTQGTAIQNHWNCNFAMVYTNTSGLGVKQSTLTLSLGHAITNT